MQPYLHAATHSFVQLCRDLLGMGLYSLRVGVVAFRDHPPQDLSFVTQVWPLSYDLEPIHQALAALIATGGGDAPEASTAGLKAALDLDWTAHTSTITTHKMIVLVTDAPPHGIGEYGDGFASGDPAGDPLCFANEMRARGMVLFIGAAEPGLTHSTHALYFYQGLAQRTGGKLCPLLSPDLLPHLITGAVREQMEMESLIGNLQSMFVMEDDIDTMAQQLHSSLTLDQVQAPVLVIPDIYIDTEQTRWNVKVWKEAENIGQAKTQVTRVTQKLKPGFHNPLLELRLKPITLDQAKEIIKAAKSR